MLSAKELFIERTKSLALSIKIDAVSNKSLTDKQHNSIARILRNGLAVVGFNALEDFIKSRTSEILSEIGRTGIPFKDLPEKLQFASTCDALNALSYQLKFQEKSNKINFIQEQTLKISSTASTAYEIFPQTFGYDSANLNEETIRDILKSFLIDNGWGEMTDIGREIGIISLPLDETFKSAMQRRHRAAHVANTDIPQRDIEQFIIDAYAISITFDCLISKAYSYIAKRNSDYLSGKSKIKKTSIKIRTIKFSDSKWKEYPPSNTKAYRTNLDKETLVADARKRARINEEIMLIFDENYGIDYWECF